MDYKSLTDSELLELEREYSKEFADIQRDIISERASRREPPMRKAEPLKYKPYTVRLDGRKPAKRWKGTGKSKPHNPKPVDVWFEI